MGEPLHTARPGWPAPRPRRLRHEGRGCCQHARAAPPRPAQAAPATSSSPRSPTRSTRASACGRSPSARGRRGDRAEPTASTSPSPTKASLVRDETRGRAAHGSRPDLGVDAILPIGPFLTSSTCSPRRITRHEPPSAARARPPCTPRWSRVAQEASTYPERCALEIERRTLPGETAADGRGRDRGRPRRARSREPDLDAERARDAACASRSRSPADAEIVRAVRARRRGGDLRPGGRGRRPHRVDGRRDPDRRRRARPSSSARAARAPTRSRSGSTWARSSSAPGRSRRSPRAGAGEARPRRSVQPAGAGSTSIPLHQAVAERVHVDDAPSEIGSPAGERTSWWTSTATRPRRRG